MEIGPTLIRINTVPDTLIARLDSRDVALWVRDLPDVDSYLDAAATLMGLPWRLVLLERYYSNLVDRLQDAETLDDPMIRRRGFRQVIDSDPSRLDLPQRCLPVYLLNGRQSGEPASDFHSQLRRLTMMEELRRASVREIVVLSADSLPVPPDLTQLWKSGVRAHLTFICADSTSKDRIAEWLGDIGDMPAVQLLLAPPSTILPEIVDRHSQTYPAEKQIVRVRDRRGEFRRIDITGVDDPERPLLSHYSIIEERDLLSMPAEELSETEFVSFFREPGGSWRPYAAGLPWLRDEQCKKVLHKHLERLDESGAEENCIAYIASESGAGGTTLARTLAWECAQLGYPVLVAAGVPFTPDALPVVNFLNGVRERVESEFRRAFITADKMSNGRSDDAAGSEPRRYDVPWVIVFDDVHWQDRSNELVRYRQELEKSGRPVCLLVVTSTVLPLEFYNESIFARLTELNHAISHDEARALGAHLNSFLRLYGKQRRGFEWDRFYEQHTVRYLDGIAAFWVALSFWVQGQYDFTESIQTWMYRCFREQIHDDAIRVAVVEIAAMSSERLPLPEVMLTSTGQWPVSHLLEDARKDLAPLGLVRLTSGGDKYWALVHDILGRFLINALFYDAAARRELGFGQARDAEHLRFLVLKGVSQKEAVGDRAMRAVGEDFATSIFKIDLERGRASFASYWREVLNALDGMPQGLRNSSRLFRHHTAVSRRRIARLDPDAYGLEEEDKRRLLERAVEDLRYALEYIEYQPGAESNLNLYNSLANAYFDLAEFEAKGGASADRIEQLRLKANEATREAYRENPTSSFVIETYVKNLLQNARASTEGVVDPCLEALGVLFSALRTNEAGYRAARLNALAQEAVELLLGQAPSGFLEREPRGPADVLLRAWHVLAEDGEMEGGFGVGSASRGSRARALQELEHGAGVGNMQVVRLKFDLVCVVRPYAFGEQLELAEQLEASAALATPQLRLEYAILLFQVGRAAEGDRMFRLLRKAWREREYFVEVPRRLRWLWTKDETSAQVVQATVASDQGHRAMAIVQQFGNALVPFRPREHGLREVKPRQRFTASVSFGHNGPFLRPVSAASGGLEGHERG